MRLYSELDLVAAECLRTGLWDELTVPELAAALSVLVFEARRPDDASPPRVPGGRVRDVIKEMVKLWGQLDALERDHHLDFLRQPDAGLRLGGLPLGRGRRARRRAQRRGAGGR